MECLYVEDGGGKELDVVFVFMVFIIKQGERQLFLMIMFVVSDFRVFIRYLQYDVYQLRVIRFLKEVGFFFVYRFVVYEWVLVFQWDEVIFKFLLLEFYLILGGLQCLVEVRVLFFRLVLRCFIGLFLRSGVGVDLGQIDGYYVIIFNFYFVSLFFICLFVVYYSIFIRFEIIVK